MMEPFPLITSGCSTLHSNVSRGTVFQISGNSAQDQTEIQLDEGEVSADAIKATLTTVHYPHIEGSDSINPVGNDVRIIETMKKATTKSWLFILVAREGFEPPTFGL